MGFSGNNNIETLLAQIRLNPLDPALYLSLAQYYYDEGEEEKARSIVIRRREMATTNAMIHRGWGELCEDLGLARQALESYQKALRFNPNDEKTLLRLAELLADVGRYEDSIHYLKKLLKRYPENEPAKNMMAENYRLLGLKGQAEALSSFTSKENENTIVRQFPISISNEDIQNVIRLFDGRERGYGLQKIDARSGELFYQIIDLPLPPEVIRAHLRGEVTLGFFPLREDKTIKVSGISVWIPFRVMAANIKNHGHLMFLMEKGRSYMLRMNSMLKSYGISSYLEDTGSYQLRLWLFFDRFIHFLKVKSLIQDLMKYQPLSIEESLMVEPIMPTVPQGVSWVEQVMMLPLGVHQGTGKRSLFLDKEGAIYPNQVKFLERIREVNISYIQQAVKNLNSKKTYQNPKSKFPSGQGPFQTLWENCLIIRKIGEKSLAGRDLLSEEKVVLFYTIGLLDQGEEWLHYLLEPGPRYHAEKVSRQARRLAPNPISCIKIRDWLPELTSSVACNCSFDLRGGKYPSPLLHVNPHSVPSTTDIDQIEKLPLKEIALRYLRLRNELEELEQIRQRTEDILERHFAKKQINRLKIQEKVLSRREYEGQITWEIGFE